VEAVMARTQTYDWQYAGDTLSRRQRIERLERLARLLDTAIVIPGTGIRFGADAVIGLLPGVGDALTAGLSAWIIYEAHKLGLPRRLLARMIANVALDSVLGAVPVAGDLFDVMWRANRRNVRLLREHLEREGLL
jgi:Domain of unknown function (DUF4112)